MMYNFRRKPGYIFGREESSVSGGGGRPYMSRSKGVSHGGSNLLTR